MKRLALLTISQLACLFAGGVTAPAADETALCQAPESEWDRFFGSVRAYDAERRRRRALVESDIQKIEAVLKRLETIV